MSDAQGAASASYAISETIHTSSHAVVYRGTRSDGRAVIIKALPSQYGPQHVERLGAVDGEDQDAAGRWHADDAATCERCLQGPIPHESSHTRSISR